MSSQRLVWIPPTMMERIRIEDHEIVKPHVLYCQRRNLSYLTVRQRISRLAQIAEAYPDQSIMAITAEQLEVMLDDLRGNNGGPLKPSSRRGFISIVRTFYKWAENFEYVEKSPMRRVVVPKIPNPPPRPIPEQELRLAITAAPSRTMYMWVLLGAAAGLRVGEIASLQWDDVGFFDKTIRVKGKGDRTRVIPIGDGLITALREHERFRTEASNVFTDAVFNRQYSPSQVTKLIAQYLGETGLPYTAHQLRHRFGTEACESSGDIRAVQDLMGHASIEQTARYTLERDKRRQAVVAGMRSATGSKSIQEPITAA